MNKEKILKDAAEYLERADIKEHLEEDLAALISIPSIASKREGIYTFGSQCANAIDKAIELGSVYGFKTENHDYYCASIIYGSKPEEVGIATHLDVVPAGNGWSYEPYRLTIEGDKYIGRGALDDKGPFICGLYAMRFLKESEKKLPFSVRLIAGSDEEVGSSDLEYFSKVRTPPLFSFTPDAEFPVCIGEKGILQVNIMLGKLPDIIAELGGGSVSNAVPDYAYAVIWDEKTDVSTTDEYRGIKLERLDAKRIKIHASGKGAHAAKPEQGINAIGVLANYLNEKVLPDSDKKPFVFLSQACGEYFGRTLGIDRVSEAFQYLTCIGGRLCVSDGIMIQNFNIRYIPDTTYKPVFEKIKKTLTPQGFAVQLVMSSEGYLIPASDDRVMALTNACEEVLGYECRPYTMGGGTYARWLANTVAFGATLQSERGKFGEGRGDAHQRDEYISSAELKKTILIYILSIMNLSESYKKKLNQ
ncbi:MAG: Sapep family Mn(2+)-dependent dipeptidase [Eubacteriales bacterium]|nr:Sapep family Mn(2+)-dependent dipeptidase [Eubacteriales bacterium]